MPRFANPYQAQTPYGRGLSNIAAALLYSGRGATAANPARDDMNVAHGDLYREQARKASAEADLAKALLEGRSYDAQTDAAAAAAEMPGYTFRGIHDANRGMGDLERYSPEEVARYRRAWASFAPGYADRTVDPSQIARALNLHKEAGDRERIISGGQDPTRTGQAYYATSGKVPFDNSASGTFNLLTGVETLNDVGRAHAGSYNAQAGASDALARQRDLETRTGIKIGAPVLVNDIEEGPIYTSPLSAPSRAPAARPVDHRPTNPPRPPAPRRISGVDRQLFETELNGLLGSLNASALDDATRKAVILQAEQEWQKGAAGHANAVQTALSNVAPQGLETPWQWRSVVPFTSSQSRPVGVAPATTPKTAPTAPGGGLPPEARARLREGTATTFGNGTTWTLQGGVPVQVQ